MSTSELSMRSTKAELFAAYQLASRQKAHRPMERMAVARLVACRTQTELASWVVDRLSAKACFGADEHAGDTIKALRIKIAAEGLTGDGETT